MRVTRFRISIATSASAIRSPAGRSIGDRSIRGRRALPRFARAMREPSDAGRKSSRACWIASSGTALFAVSTWISSADSRPPRNPRRTPHARSVRRSRAACAIGATLKLGDAALVDRAAQCERAEPAAARRRASIRVSQLSSPTSVQPVASTSSSATRPGCAFTMSTTVRRHCSSASSRSFRDSAWQAGAETARGGTGISRRRWTCPRCSSRVAHSRARRWHCCADRSRQAVAIARRRRRAVVPHGEAEHHRAARSDGIEAALRRRSVSLGHRFSRGNRLSACAALPRARCSPPRVGNPLASRRQHLSFDETPGSPWLIMPPEVRASFERITAPVLPLAASPLGRPLLGVKTGCNEAFVVARVDRAGRNGNQQLAAIESGELNGLGRVGSCFDLCTGAKRFARGSFTLLRNTSSGRTTRQGRCHSSAARATLAQQMETRAGAAE